MKTKQNDTRIIVQKRKKLWISD